MQRAITSATNASAHLSVAESKVDGIGQLERIATGVKINNIGRDTDD